MNLKKKEMENLFTSKFVGTGPTSYEKRIYRVAVLQWLRNTVLYDFERLFQFFLLYGVAARDRHTTALSLQLPLSLSQIFLRLK